MKRSIQITTQRLLLLCTVFLMLGTAKSQTYPISAQLSTAPPYSIFFTDYSMGSNIQFSLVDRHIDSDMQQVYLNIELEGGGIRLKTLPSFRPSSYIDVVPGNMLTLTNADLIEYFNLNSLNLEGISREAFSANAQQLPEGLYKLKIKAIHATMGVQVTNEALAIMGLFKGQPPFINIPSNNGKVNENPTQNFTINWTNRNSATFNQANLPSYRVQMWEMLDPSQDPNIIVNSNYPPILDDFTNMTTYQHGASNTTLTAGKVYAIRVQVVDPDGRDMYSNNGYSQVVKFTYGDACNPPTNLTATLDPRGIAVNWALTPNQGGYRLQYGRIDTAWIDADVLINRFQIDKTYPSAQYRMQVATLCGNGKQSDYSDVVFITTKPSNSNNQAACGDPFPKINIKTQKLLQSLAVGDKFSAYDFDVTVTRMFRNDSTSYKGEGTTPFNMLGGVPTVVYFDGIKINTDRQLIGDVPVKFQQKPYVFSDKNLKQFKEDFKDTKEMATGDDSADPEAVNVSVTIGSITYDSTKKQIIINDEQGNVNKTLTSGKDYKITDKDGNVYLVSKDNKITKQPKATEATVKNGGPVKDGGLNTDLYFVQDQPILTFEAHPQQTWSFDAMELNTMADLLYENVRNDLEAYYVPYKSIGSAGTDKVLAKLYANPLEVDLRRIKFKTNAGIAVPFVYDSLKKEWMLTITAPLHRQDFSVFPYYGNGKDTLCGKLNVMPLDRKEVNLVLVPLNGYKASNVKQADVENYLNKVYHQANIAYKVSIDNAFSTAAADLPLSVEHGKLEGEYSENQAKVIVDYQVAHPEQDNTIYMFLCKEGSNSDVKGHTPVNRSYGFLFGEILDQRTFAHEVGHGYPLALEHPFTSGGATGTYSNLMDYASSTNLSFKQWGLAHNPKLKVRFGQGSDQGQMLANKLYYRPDGKIFISTSLAHENMPVAEIQSGLYPNGAIYEFKLDGIYYAAVIVDNKFKGYYPNGNESKKRYAPEIDYQKINKENTDKGIPTEVIYTKSVSKCTWERIKTTYKKLTDLDVIWPNEGEGYGYPLATAIPMENAKVYQSGRFDKCEDFDEEAEPIKGTQGYKFYVSNVTGETDQDKLYLKKTGNIINKLGPEIYEAFYKRVKVDGQLKNYSLLEAILFSYQLRDKKEKTRPWKDIYEAIKLFSIGVDELKSKTFTTRKGLVDHCNIHFVNKAPEFRYFFDVPFAALTTDRRNQLMSLYKGVKANEITERHNIAELIGDKEVINSIIKYASPTDGKKFLDHLYNENILSAVIESFDSYFYGGLDELTEVVGNLNKLVKAGYPLSAFESERKITTLFDYIEQDRYLYFDDSYVGDLNSESMNYLSSDISFSIESLNPFTNETKYNINVKPYTYILVKFMQNVKLGGRSYSADSTYKVPALMVYLVFSKNTRDKIMKSGEIAVDAASLAVGIGAFNAAVKTARLGLVIYEGYELLNDIVGITVTAYEQDLRTHYPKLYDGYMVYSRAFTVSKWTAKLTGADESMRMLVGEQYFGSRKIANDASAPSKVQEFAEQYKNHLEEQYPDFIDEINQYLVMTRAKFDPSFRDKMEDFLVDYIRNKLTADQISKLNIEIKAKPSFLDDLNGDPRNIDSWLNNINLNNINIKLLFANPTLKKMKEDILSGDIPRKYENLISVEEQAIIRFYTTDEGYRDFNKALRGEIPMTDFYREQEKLLNMALDKLPKVGNGMTVYRGTGKPEIEMFRKMKEGQEFETKDYSSFSTFVEKALDFYYRREKQTGEAAMIYIKKAYKGVNIVEFSDAPKEAEVLYRSKLKFRFVDMKHGVIDYDIDNLGIRITIEEIW